MNNELNAIRIRVCIAVLLILCGFVLLACYGWNWLTIAVFAFGSLMTVTLGDKAAEGRQPNIVGFALFVGAVALILFGIFVWNEETKSLREQYLGGIFTQNISVTVCFLSAIPMGAGGIFLMFPPLIGKTWKQIKGDENDNQPVSIMSSFGDYQQTGSGEQNMKSQAITQMINSDSFLQSLIQADPGLPAKIQATLDYYNPQMGVFGSWAARMRSEGRGKLLEVLNKEQQEVIKQAALFEQQVLDGRRKQAEFQIFLAQNHYQLLQLKQTVESNQQWFDFSQKAYDRDLMPEDLSGLTKEKELAKIRAEEHEGEISRNLGAAKRFKQTEDEITEDLRRKLEKALIKLDQTEQRTDLSERSKRELVASIENEVANLKFRIAAREKRAQQDEEAYL